MPIINQIPSQTEDEYTNSLQKTKKELKKEQKQKKKEEKKELKIQKKKEKNEKKMKENQEKGELYALNIKKKKKDIKKEIKKINKLNKKNSKLNNSDERDIAILNSENKEAITGIKNEDNKITDENLNDGLEDDNEILNNKSEKEINDTNKDNNNIINSISDEEKNDTIKDIKNDTIRITDETLKNNEYLNDKIDNYVSNNDNIIDEKNDAKDNNENIDKDAIIIDNEEENDEENNEEEESEENNDDEDYNSDEYEEQKAKIIPLKDSDDNSNENMEKINKEVPENNKFEANDSILSKNIEKRENLLNDNSDKNEKDQTKSINIDKERNLEENNNKEEKLKGDEKENDDKIKSEEKNKKKKEEIEAIEDDLPLAILRYKNPQPEQKTDEEEEEEPLYNIKMKCMKRKSTSASSLLNGRSMLASDLLNRVRYSMALRSGNFTSNMQNYNGGIRKCQSYDLLKSYNNDEDEDISLAEFKEKRAEYLTQLNEMQTKRLSTISAMSNNAPSNNRNIVRNSGMCVSYSSGCLSSYNRPVPPNSVGPVNGMIMNRSPMNGMVMNGAPINGMAMNGVPINGMAMNGIPKNGKYVNSSNESLNNPLLMSIVPEMYPINNRQSFITPGYNRNSMSLMSLAELNKSIADQEIQRKRQSIIESNKRRSQIMMNGYTPNEKLKSSNNSITSGNASGSNSNSKKNNYDDKENKPSIPHSFSGGNLVNQGRYENEIQEYPGQKFVTFTPLEFNTFPATASVRVIPGQSKRDKLQRRSLAVEVQAPKDNYIPIETKENNYMEIENLKYRKQKKKEIQEYKDKINSWINNSESSSQSKNNN